MLITHNSLPFFFFFNDTATTEIYTLSLHDALPIRPHVMPEHVGRPPVGADGGGQHPEQRGFPRAVAATDHDQRGLGHFEAHVRQRPAAPVPPAEARRSDRDHPADATPDLETGQFSWA